MTLQEIFEKIVRIDSTSGHEQKMIEYLIQFCSKFNVSIQKDSYGNLFVKRNGVGNPLLLCAHVDTVQPGEGIIPVLQDGVFYSKSETILGADNKVAVAILLKLISDIENDDSSRPLEFVFTKSEEIANLGAINLDYSQITAKEGLTFDRSAELGTIVIASPFYNALDITIVGKAAHASRPDVAINVLPIFANVINHLKLGKLSENTIFNIGEVKGGIVRNSVPGELLFISEIRSYDEQELDSYTNSIVQTVKNEAEKMDATIKYKIYRENSGYKYAESDLFIQSIAKTIKNSGISTISYEQTWGCSDANIFSEHGIKVINIADATYDTHTTNEHVALTDMEKLLQIIKDFIAD